MKKSQTLFNELLNEWLENKRSEVKISTFCKYEQLIRLHLKPHFEELNCTNMNQIFLQNYYEILKNNAKDCRPLSNGTLRCICMILNSALQYGQQNGYLKNLYRITPKLSRERHLVHVFSKEHQTLLEEYLFNNASIYSCGILLALYSGIRIGELCALTYDDLDLTNGYVKIVRTVQRTRTVNTNNGTKSKTELVIFPPKSRSAYRLIPLPDFLIEYLDQNLIFSQNRSYIFSKSGKTPLDPRTLQHHYKKILKEIQIPYLNFHCLRHTFATRCITLGWDVRTLSEILGHSDIKITMEYYFHSSLEYKRQQMQKFEPMCQVVE